MMSKPYTVKIRLRPENVLPDVWDWLEQHGISHVNGDWGWHRVFGDRLTDAEFSFRRPEHATLFALRWA
jgi:hypothetical protein